jgi:hypothetical protein
MIGGLPSLRRTLALARSQTGLTRCETLDLGSLVADLLRAGDPGGLTVRSKLEPAGSRLPSRDLNPAAWCVVPNRVPVGHGREHGAVDPRQRAAATVRALPANRRPGDARRGRARTWARRRQGHRRRARRPRHSPCPPGRRPASRGRLPVSELRRLVSNSSPACPPARRFESMRVEATA